MAIQPEIIQQALNGLAFTDAEAASPPDPNNNYLLPAAGTAGVLGATGLGAYAVNRLNPQLLQSAANRLAPTFGNSMWTNPAVGAQRLLGTSAPQAWANAAQYAAQGVPVAASRWAPLATAAGTAAQAVPLAAPLASARIPGAPPAAGNPSGALSIANATGGAAGRRAALSQAANATGMLGKARALVPSIPRAIGGAGLGMLGSSLLDMLPGENSTIEQGLQGAALGAGIGSAVPVVGTGIGALVGGGLGVLSSALGGEEEGPSLSQTQTSTMHRMQQAMTIAGVPGVNQQQFMQSLRAQIAMLDPESPTYEADVQATLEMAPTLAADLISQAPLLQQQAAQQARQQAFYDPQHVMQLQAQVGQYMQQFTNPMMQQANSIADLMRSSAANLSPAYSNAMNIQAGILQQNAANQAAAYQSQIQSLPAFMMFNQAMASGVPQQQISDATQMDPAVAPEIAQLLGMAG